MDDNSFIDYNNREKTMKIQAFINQHKVPTTSWLIATQFVVDNHRDLDASEYRVRIIELTGRGDELTDREAEYTYLYLIQEIFTIHFRDPEEPINMAIMYNIAERKAIDYIEANPYLFVEHEVEVKVDANGKVKKKRGAKKDLVCKLWADHKDEGWPRKQWIQFLVDEADMTPAGASTYYASLKNGTFGC